MTPGFLRRQFTHHKTGALEGERRVGACPMKALDLTTMVVVVPVAAALLVATGHAYPG